MTVPARPMEGQNQTMKTKTPATGNPLDLMFEYPVRCTYPGCENAHLLADANKLDEHITEDHIAQAVWEFAQDHAQEAAVEPGDTAIERCPTVVQKDLSLEEKMPGQITRIPYSGVVGCGFMKDGRLFVIIPPQATKEETEAIADKIESVLVGPRILPPNQEPEGVKE